jgi:hypothetical protein
MQMKTCCGISETLENREKTPMHRKHACAAAKTFVHKRAKLAHGSVTHVQGSEKEYPVQDTVIGSNKMM